MKRRRCLGFSAVRAFYRLSWNSWSPDWGWNCRMHLAFSCPCFLFTVLISYGWARQYLDAFPYACVRMCALFETSSPWGNLIICWTLLTNEKRTSGPNIWAKTLFLKKCLVFPHEEIHNIRRWCWMCHWCWRMWHIEDTQAFPQTKIWGEPTFLFSCCLWGNNTIIVLSIINYSCVKRLYGLFNFCLKGIPTHCRTLR